MKLGYSLLAVAAAQQDTAATGGNCCQELQVFLSIFYEFYD